MKCNIEVESSNLFSFIKEWVLNYIFILALIAH